MEIIVWGPTGVEYCVAWLNSMYFQKESIMIYSDNLLILEAVAQTI